MPPPPLDLCIVILSFRFAAVCFLQYLKISRENRLSGHRRPFFKSRSRRIRINCIRKKHNSNNNNKIAIRRIFHSQPYHNIKPLSDGVKKKKKRKKIVPEIRRILYCRGELYKSRSATRLAWGGREGGECTLSGHSYRYVSVHACFLKYIYIRIFFFVNSINYYKVNGGVVKARHYT